MAVVWPVEAARKVAWPSWAKPTDLHNGKGRSILNQYPMIARL